MGRIARWYLADGATLPENVFEKGCAWPREMAFPSKKPGVKCVTTRLIEQYL
jgi:hypothetical protein